MAGSRERSRFQQGESHGSYCRGGHPAKQEDRGLDHLYIWDGAANGMVILKKANVNPSTRVRDLTEEEVGRIREVVDREYRVEGDLRREVQLNIKRLMDIACYRGLRH